MHMMIFSSWLLLRISSTHVQLFSQWGTELFGAIWLLLALELSLLLWEQEPDLVSLLFFFKTVLVTWYFSKSHKHWMENDFFFIFLSHLGYIILTEKSAVIFMFVPLYIMLLSSLAAFKIFLSLVLRNMIMMCFDLVFFVFSISRDTNLWIYFAKNLRKIWVIISSNQLFWPIWVVSELIDALYFSPNFLFFRISL